MARQPTRVVLSLATGDRYTAALDLLLRSIRRLGEPPACKVACLNWSGDLLNGFQARYPDVEFISLPPRHTGPDPKAVAISLKAEVIHTVLCSTPANSTVLYTDADHIVLKQLHPWFDFMSAYDLALRHRPECLHDARYEYLAGVVGVRNTDGGRRAVETWRTLIAGRTLTEWVDQETLPAVADFCRTHGIAVWRMGQDVLSVDSDVRDCYLWARKNSELRLRERLRHNEELLSSLDQCSRPELS